MTDRPTFMLTLRPEPGVDPERALKGLLKVALRAFKLRCVMVAIEPPAEREGL